MKKEKSEQPISIMACDPSITAWGLVIIQEGKIVHVNCIKTSPENKKTKIRKGDDRVRRVSEINNILLETIKKYNVKYILTEQPHGSQSASAAIMIGIVTGILQTLGDCLDIGIEWYSEGDCKKHLLGKRSAIKDETIKAVKKIYDVPWFNVGYKDEAVADALAVFHIARSQSPIVKYYQK